MWALSSANEDEMRSGVGSFGNLAMKGFGALGNAEPLGEHENFFDMIVDNDNNGASGDPPDLAPSTGSDMAGRDVSQNTMFVANDGVKKLASAVDDVAKRLLETNNDSDDAPVASRPDLWNEISNSFRLESLNTSFNGSFANIASESLQESRNFVGAYWMGSDQHSAIIAHMATEAAKVAAKQTASGLTTTVLTTTSAGASIFLKIIVGVSFFFFSAGIIFTGVSLRDRIGPEVVAQGLKIPTNLTEKLNKTLPSRPTRSPTMYPAETYFPTSSLGPSVQQVDSRFPSPSITSQPSISGVPTQSQSTTNNYTTLMPTPSTNPENNQVVGTNLPTVTMSPLGLQPTRLPTVRHSSAVEMGSLPPTGRLVSNSNSPSTLEPIATESTPMNPSNAPSDEAAEAIVPTTLPAMKPSSLPIGEKTLVPNARPNTVKTHVPAAFTSTVPSTSSPGENVLPNNNPNNTPSPSLQPNKPSPSEQSKSPSNLINTLSPSQRDQPISVPNAQDSRTPSIVTPSGSPNDSSSTPRPVLEYE
jgi:hypothetical protein